MQTHSISCTNHCHVTFRDQRNGQKTILIQESKDEQVEAYLESIGGRQNCQAFIWDEDS